MPEGAAGPVLLRAQLQGHGDPPVCTTDALVHPGWAVEWAAATVEGVALALRPPPLGYGAHRLVAVLDTLGLHTAAVRFTLTATHRTPLTTGGPQSVRRRRS